MRSLSSDIKKHWYKCLGNGYDDLSTYETEYLCKGSDNVTKAYILGDMLKQGSIIMREKEAEALRKAGYDVYSAIEEKDINDKSAVTENDEFTAIQPLIHTISLISHSFY